MFWCLVRFSTGALSLGLDANRLEMAVQSAVVDIYRSTSFQLTVIA